MPIEPSPNEDSAFLTIARTVSVLAVLSWLSIYPFFAISPAFANGFELSRGEEPVRQTIWMIGVGGIAALPIFMGWLAATYTSRLGIRLLLLFLLLPVATTVQVAGTFSWTHFVLGAIVSFSSISQVIALATFFSALLLRSRLVGQSDEVPPSSRQFTFSLAHLFILTTAVAVIIGVGGLFGLPALELPLVVLAVCMYSLPILVEIPFAFLLFQGVCGGRENRSLYLVISGIVFGITTAIELLIASWLNNDTNVWLLRLLVVRFSFAAVLLLLTISLRLFGYSLERKRKPTFAIEASKVARPADQALSDGTWDSIAN